MKTILHAFQCNEEGVSEGYLGARWAKGLSQLCEVSLLTGDPAAKHDCMYRPSLHWNPKNKFVKKVNDAIKFDYFYFNNQSLKRYEQLVREADILHHVSPVAPRYPVSLSKYANRFVLGPIAGGLRAPSQFAAEVEGSEEFFFKLRNFDALRFKYDNALKNTYDRADKILIAGDYLLSILPKQFHHKCTPMLDVGIDTKLYEYKPRNFYCDTFNLIYVGRVVPYKGLLYLLKALTRLPKDVLRSIRLDIAGNKNDNEYEKSCRDFIQLNRLEKNVKFHGFLSKCEVQALYDKSHLFCFPSLAEAGGTVVLEAMAKGVPVLAVNYGGPASSVTNSSGILIDPISPESLIDSLTHHISTLFSNQEKVMDYSLIARQRVENKFDWSKRCEQIVELYKEF